MSKKEKSSISELLRLIADKTDRYPKFFSDLKQFVLNYSTEEKSREDLVDIWTFYNQGLEEFEKALAGLTNRQLVAIIQKNNFDSTKLSHKWKDAEKLKELIRERMSNRSNKGTHFLDFGKSGK